MKKLFVWVVMLAMLMLLFTACTSPDTSSVSEDSGMDETVMPESPSPYGAT